MIREQNMISKRQQQIVMVQWIKEARGREQDCITASVWFDTTFPRLYYGQIKAFGPHVAPGVSVVSVLWIHVCTCLCVFVYSGRATVHHSTCAHINQTYVLNERLVICARTHTGALWLFFGVNILLMFASQNNLHGSRKRAQAIKAIASSYPCNQ